MLARLTEPPALAGVQLATPAQAERGEGTVASRLVDVAPGVVKRAEQAAGPPHLESEVKR